MRFAFLAAVLGAGVACPALAGAPGTLDPSPGAEAGWSLAGPADVADFRFTLTPGADYAFGMDGTVGRAELFAPGGRSLGTIEAGDRDAAAELHAATAGTYLLRVTASPLHAPFPADFPGSGHVWVWPDCRGGPGTRCTIGDGRTRSGTLAGLGDADGYLVSGVPGAAYEADMDAVAGDEELGLVDRAGRWFLHAEVARAVPGGGDGGPARIAFRLPTTGGPFFLKVVSRDLDPGNEAHSAYTLRLRRR